MPGPSRQPGQESADVLHLRPPAPGGADLFTAAALLGPGFLRRSENVRLADGRISRRAGVGKIARIASTCASKTFGTTGKYATIPAASQLLIPYGGFALHFSFTAVRALVSAQLIYGQDGADSVPPIDVSLDSSGHLVCTVNWDGGGSETFQSGVLTDGSTQHALLVYDYTIGSVCLALNGVMAIPEIVGASVNKRPVQTANMAWLVGAKKTAASVVSLPFLGKIDSLTLWMGAGTGTSRTAGYISTLVAHSRRQWPNPLADDVLFNYDMDETSATSMRDTSRYANHASVTGTPTVTAEVALSSVPCNFVGALDATDGSRSNIVGVAGNLYYQKTRLA